MIKRIFFLFFFFLTTACYKDHLYVQQEWVGKDDLASTHVDTPDPRSKHPKTGQQIIVCWDFPLSIYKKELSMKLQVRFWDQTQKEELCVLDKKRGYAAFFFENDKKLQDKKILTYRIEIHSKDNELVEEWVHQFWTESISVD